MDITKRVNKFQYYGLLDKEFEYLVINKLINVRNRFIEETAEISDSDYDTFVKNINPVNLCDEMYVKNLQRNLTTIEQVSLMSIQLLETALNYFEDTSRVDEELYYQIFRAYDIATYCNYSIKLLRLQDRHDGNIEHQDKYYSDIIVNIVEYTKPLVVHRNKFDESKSAGRSHFKTKVLTEIVKEYHETKGARPSVESVLQQIEDNYCGHGGLIDYPDDIDREDKLLHFRQHGRQRGESVKRITFKTLNNQISKIYKKISH